jgi:hypothetical protein
VTPASPARLRLVAAGRTNQDFAAWSGFHKQHVSDVLRSKCPASPNFRKLLSEYLDIDEETLFPLEHKTETAPTVSV